MANPNLPLLEDAVRKLAPFLDEIVFVGGVTLGLLITDEAAEPRQRRACWRNRASSMCCRDSFWMTSASL